MRVLLSACAVAISVGIAAVGCGGNGAAHARRAASPSVISSPLASCVYGDGLSYTPPTPQPSPITCPTLPSAVALAPLTGYSPAPLPAIPLPAGARPRTSLAPLPIEKGSVTLLATDGTGSDTFRLPLQRATCRTPKVHCSGRKDEVEQAVFGQDWIVYFECIGNGPTPELDAGGSSQFVTCGGPSISHAADRSVGDAHDLPYDSVTVTVRAANNIKWRIDVEALPISGATFG